MNRTGLKSIVVSFGIMSICSCLPQRKSPSAADAVVSSLEVSGLVSNPGGGTVQGAEVFVERDPIAVAKTGADGSFKFRLDETALRTIQASLTPGQESWRLYIRQIGTIELAGFSKPIGVSQRGAFNAGVTVVQPAVTVRGVVLKAAANQVSPAAGATVTIGREQTTTAANGTFSLSGIPAGKLSATAQLVRFEPTTTEIEVVAGENIFLEDPLVLFQNSAPNAVLLVNPWNPTTANPNTPTTRTFKVLASPSAKLIRYSHLLSDLRDPQSGAGGFQQEPVNGSSGGGSSPGGESGFSGTGGRLQSVAMAWKPIPSEITYSFQSEGPASLWFQTADASERVKSDTYQVSLNINSCEMLQGIAIGDGSGVITQKKTLVTFKGLPSNATRVKLSEDIASLGQSSWLALAPALEFVFSTTPTGLDSVGSTRQVFAQVGTTSGDCPVVSASVNLLTFPTSSPNMVIINGGAPMTASRIVQVDLPELPPNAYEMRLSEGTTPLSDGAGPGGGASNSTPWLRAQPQTIFIFQGIGTRLLNLQLRDVDGLTSPSYTASITVAPPQDAGFSISFAQINPLVVLNPPPPSRYLVLQFQPPANAVGYRVMEHITDSTDPDLGGQNNGGGRIQSTDPTFIQNFPWMNLVPVLPIYAAGIGLRTFIVQYLGIDGFVTTVSQQILIAPVIETLGQFRINDGGPLAIYPTIKLYVIPPPTAIAMSATNLTLQQTTANSSTTFVVGANSFGSTTSSNDQWVALSPSMDFKLDSRGVQSIQLRFKDANGIISTPAPVQSVVFDPYPPYPIGSRTVVANNDDAVTTSPLIKLRIIAPESAYAYRVSTDPSFNGVSEFRDIPNVAKTPLAGVGWMAYQFDTDYIITGPTGPRIIYVQFRNEVGDRSNAYTDTIDFQPAP